MSQSYKIDNVGVTVTSFRAGADKGRSVQLTGPDGFVQLNVAELKALLPVLHAFVSGTSIRFVTGVSEG